MNGTGWRDASVPASDSIPLDVPIGTTGSAGTDAVLIGHRTQFTGIAFDIGQAGMGGSLAWWYWDGSAFRPMALEQDLSRTGTVEVTLPALSDWTATTDGYMCEAGLYYIFVTTDDGYTAIPIADQMWLPGTPPPTGGGGGGGGLGGGLVHNGGTSVQAY